jgi:CRISPR-associated endoribonuclease Cas6
MPSRWEVLLTGPVDAAIPLTAPLAVVSTWLDDPSGLGQRRSGHNDQARKWAFGPLRVAQPTAVALQVRLLDDNLASRLRAATGASQSIRLGTHHFQITQPAELVEQVSWQQLRRWSGARAWQLKFLTPACFRRGNRTSPWPAPESIARGLTDRWQQLHPDTAPPRPQPGSGPVWVSDVDGRSETQNLTRNVHRNGWHLEDEIISGFTGRIRYVCDHGTNDDAATFDALMSFAAFAGVGSHTTHGFGVVTPEPTWQPPTTKAANFGSR